MSETALGRETKTAVTRVQRARETTALDTAHAACVVAEAFVRSLVAFRGTLIQTVRETRGHNGDTGGRQKLLFSWEQTLRTNTRRQAKRSSPPIPPSHATLSLSHPPHALLSLSPHQLLSLIHTSCRHPLLSRRSPLPFVAIWLLKKANSSVGFTW